ncbi:MAG: NAD(P)/FAD-dependent oxidoreductase, partial [Dehalococcoidia bacterium]
MYLLDEDAKGTPMPTPNEDVEAWLAEFDAVLRRSDWTAAADLFAEDSYWRDFTAFTWNLKTLEGPEAICAMLAARGADTGATSWFLDGDATIDATGVTEAWLRFETKVGRGQGILRLRDGKAWVLFTALRELKGFEEQHDASRP